VRTTWRVLAAHRDLRLALSAGLISASGDWVLLIGLLYQVYAMTGSTVASAFTMLSAGVPQVLLGPVAGTLADRWDRKKTMVYADVLLATGLLPLLAVHGRGDVWIVYLVLVWEGAVQQFFSPAQLAMVPRLVPDDRLPAANAISGQVGDVARLAGSALGGVLAAVGGLATVTIVDSASFIASAGLLVALRTSGQVTREAASSTRLASVATDLRAGLLLVGKSRTLRALLLFGLATSLGEGVFATLVTPFVEHTLHGTSRQFGLFAAAQAVGGIAGGVFATSVSHRIPASRLLGYGAVAFGTVDLAIFLYPVVYVSLWPAVIGMIVAGLPSALAGAGMMTLLQRGVQDSARGRLFGTLGAVQGLAMLVGTLAAGYLSSRLGTIPVITFQGGVWLLAGLAVVIRTRGTDSLPSAQKSAGQEPVPLWQQEADATGRSSPAQRA
jgi:MFS family permease